MSQGGKDIEMRPVVDVAEPEGKIPASEYVGHGVSLIAPTSPFNAGQIIESTENLGVVTPIWGDDVVTIPGTQISYRIPSNFRLESKGVESKYHDLLSATGKNMAEKAASDASIRASYFGVSATPADYSYAQALDEDRIYGLFTLDQNTYSVSLRPQFEIWDNIVPHFVSAIQALPTWDEENEGTVETWRRFFDSWGTHVVLELLYGNRYQLRVESGESPPLSPQRWAACIEKDYAGIIPQTQGPPTEEEMVKYHSTKTSICYVIGGDRQKAMSLAADHKNQDKLEKWAASLEGVYDGIINIKVKSFYTLLSESPSSDHKAAAEKINDGLSYFLSISPGPGPPPPPPTGEYVVTIVNNRGADTTYAFFVEPPDFTGGRTTWMNVWTSSNVASEASHEIKVDEEIYAWVGTAPSPPQPGVIISTGMSLPARLGTGEEPGSSFEMRIRGEIQTIEEHLPAGGFKGAFEILSGSDFTLPNEKWLVGIGKKNHRDQVVPMTSMAPYNNMSYQIFPKAIFFVSESQQVVGEIADYSSVSREGARIDFTTGPGMGKSLATVTQDNTGRFAIEYHDKE